MTDFDAAKNVKDNRERPRYAKAAVYKTGLVTVRLRRSRTQKKRDGRDRRERAGEKIGQMADEKTLGGSAA